MTKDEIIEAIKQMNVVELSDVVKALEEEFGVSAAAEHLLGKSPANLTPYDAALLVSVLPSPKRLFVTNPSEYVRTRTSQIESAVQQLGGPAYLDGL